MRVSRTYGYYEVLLFLSMSFFFGSLVIEIGKQHYCYNNELECDQESCVIEIWNLIDRMKPYLQELGSVLEHKVSVGIEIVLISSWSRSKIYIGDVAATHWNEI